MKRLIILIITIIGISLVGCKSDTDNIVECYHTPSCKTFREHDLLVLKESEQESNIYNRQESINDNNYNNENNNKESDNYTESKETYYRVITGSYENKENANKHVEELKSKNIDCFISESVVDGQIRYRIVTGSFANKENANNYANILNELGYETFISEYTKE